jgi:hypothetical protein
MNPGVANRLRWVALILLVSGGVACAGTWRSDAPVREPPPDSPLAGIESGMSGLAVRELLGSPSEMRAYQNFKAWVPFYFGPHTSRTDWDYAGQGRVVFSRNRYSGRLTVLEVFYDPSLGG